MNFWEQERKIRYLRGYERSLHEEKKILESIRWLQLRYAAPGMKELDGMPTGSVQSDLSDYAAKLDELQKQYVGQLQKTLDQRQQIQSSIDAMSDETEQDLLRYRYIELLTWEQVAEKIDKQVRWTYELHLRALEHFRIGGGHEKS